MVRAAVAALVLALALAPAAAGKQKPRPPSKPNYGHAQYVLSGGVEAFFEEKGINGPDGKHQEVLQVSCIGQGLPGRQQNDQFGVPEATYHLFLCTVTTSKMQYAQFKLHVFQRGVTWEWISTGF